jgi:hypothetical protein
MCIRTRSLFTAVVFVAALGAARPAQAGPPLLCHPFDIGSAASLPWSGHSSWFDGKPDYRLSSLVSDTEALLVPSTPVVVRMETLRRAAIYASHDPQVASSLLERLTAKAQPSKTAGRADALALLDVAYVTEALRQITQIGGVTGYKDRVPAIIELVRDRDGWQQMKASLAASPDDPGLQFAAALIVAGKDRGAYLEHARRARAGAQKDALVARNLKPISGAQ